MAKRQKHGVLCSVGRAEALGRREFKKGAMRVPAFSRRAKSAIRNCASQKQTISYLTAWLRGWDKENLRDSPRVHPGLPPRLSGSFLSKLFGKKKPRVNPMSRRIYMVKTKSGTYMPATVASMQGARRRKRRRRR